MTCLTSFVYGQKYQNYIPLLIYSIKKAYSEYNIIIFVHSTLNPNVKKQLDALKRTYSFEIIENVFDDCPHMTPAKSRALRWVLWSPNFDKFDYIYTVDIDIFYLNESPSLHFQHIQHMKHVSLPFSNIVRVNSVNKLSIINILRKIKYSGIKNMYSFLSSSGNYIHLSGLHFVDRKEYYAKLNGAKRQYYKNMIYQSHSVDWSTISGEINDEIFLYDMISELGWDISTLGVQTDPVSMLDFRNPNRDEFRPHHGIHLGIFRNSKLDTGSEEIAESEIYRYYINELLKSLHEDIMFVEIANNFSDSVRQLFLNLFKYYSVDNSVYRYIDKTNNH